MNQKNNVKISEMIVTGINNPNLTIAGEFLDEEEDVVLTLRIDGKETEFAIIPIVSNYFAINHALNNYDKIAELYVTDKETGREYMIASCVNNKFGRIMTKIKKIISKFLSKIWNVMLTIWTLMKYFGRGIRFLWREHHFLVPPVLWKKYFKALMQRLRHPIPNNTYHPFITDEYNLWLKEQEKYRKVEPIIDFTYQPLISFVIPVYNVEKNLLEACLDSVLNQTYSNFEICIADDCSTNEETITTLKAYEAKDKRVKVVYRSENGHISRASNSALEIATGEFMAMMDNDDVITEDALYEIVKALNEDPTIDMIYSDEDKLDLDGRRCHPHFKSDYAPDTFLTGNYFCHFTVLRTSIVREIGGWKVGFEGAQDYDLFLRFSEVTSRIHHISKILYHWRMIPGSTSMDIDSKGYAVERGRLAIAESLERRNIKANVHVHEKIPHYWVEYLYDEAPKVSIIIPTKDHANTLNDCLKSIYAKTTYNNFEVIVINNNSEQAATFTLFDHYKSKYDNFSIFDANMEFNYSRINNLAVEQATGEYIVLLNNDTTVITPNWLEIMVGYAMQEHIGAVGAKLLYPDNTVQHGGIILGLGIASHAFLDAGREDVGFYGRLTVPHNYMGVTAACLMIKKSKYLEMNGLDEELKVAYNDVDFNIRLYKAGYYNVFVPLVELYHHESKSRGLDTTKEKYKRFIAESEYIYNKWSDLIKDDPFYNINLSRFKSFLLDKYIPKKSSAKGDDDDKK